MTALESMMDYAWTKIGDLSFFRQCLTMISGNWILKQ